MNKNVLVSLMLLIVTLLSCTKIEKKDKELDLASANKLMSSQKNIYKYTDWPSVNNGMLVFRDSTHLLNYITFLDSIIDPQNYPTPSLTDTGVEFDQDQLLQNVESVLGFTSIRNIAHAGFLRQNEIGWNTLEEVPKEHFINDILIRSILNAQLDMQVGNSYVHYINESLVVSVDETRPDLSASFHKFPISAQLVDIINIDPTHQYSRIEQVTKEGISLVWDKIVRKPTGAGDKIVNLTYTQPDCNNPLKVVFSNAELTKLVYDGNGNASDLPTAARFVINFGDNTPLLGPLNTTISSGNYYQVILADFDHGYSNPGNYTVHIKAWKLSNNTSTPDAELDYPITVKIGQCKQIQKATDDEFHYTPYGGRAWSGKTSVLRTSNLLGTKIMRIVSETSSWLKSGSKWKQSNARIWSSVATTILDKDCNFNRYRSGEGEGNKAKHLVVHRTDAPYWWSIVNTKHGIFYDNSWYYFDKIMNVCP